MKAREDTARVEERLRAATMELRLSCQSGALSQFKHIMMRMLLGQVRYSVIVWCRDMKAAQKAAALNRVRNIMARTT